MGMLDEQRAGVGSGEEPAEDRHSRGVLCASTHFFLMRAAHLYFHTWSRNSAQPLRKSGSLNVSRDQRACRNGASRHQSPRSTPSPNPELSWRRLPHYHHSFYHLHLKHHPEVVVTIVITNVLVTPRVTSGSCPQSANNRASENSSESYLQPTTQVQSTPNVRSVQHLTQPLYGVEQDVALPDDRLVLRVLDRRAIRLHDTVDLVDRTVQPSRCNEA